MILILKKNQRISQEIIEPLIIKLLLEHLLIISNPRIDNDLIKSYKYQNEQQIGFTFEKVFACNLYLKFQNLTTVYDFVSMIIGNDMQYLNLIPLSWKEISFPKPRHIFSDTNPKEDDFQNNCFQDFYLPTKLFGPDLIFQHLLFSMKHSFEHTNCVRKGECDKATKKNDPQYFFTDKKENDTTDKKYKNFWINSIEKMDPLIRVNVLIPKASPNSEKRIFFSRGQIFFFEYKYGQH